MVALIELLRPFQPSRAALVVGMAVVVVSGVTLVGNMRSYNQEVVQYKHTTRTFMVAAEAIPARINPRRIMPFSLNVVTAGQYLAAVHHLGSGVDGVTLHDLGTQTERATADSWMVQDLGLRVVPAPEPGPAGCAPSAGGRDIAVPRGATLVVHSGSSAATVALRRLAYRFGSPLASLRANATGTLAIPVDHSTLPWHARVTGVGASVRVCRAS